LFIHYVFHFHKKTLLQGKCMPCWQNYMSSTILSGHCEEHPFSDEAISFSQNKEIITLEERSLEMTR